MSLGRPWRSGNGSYPLFNGYEWMFNAEYYCHCITILLTDLSDSCITSNRGIRTVMVIYIFIFHACLYNVSVAGLAQPQCKRWLKYSIDTVLCRTNLCSNRKSTSHV